MSAVFSCSRCSQVLPATAKFCRRCGAVIERNPTPAEPVVATRGKAVSSALVAAVLVSLALGALVIFGTGEMHSVTPLAPVYSVPPVQPVYPPFGANYTNYPPRVIIPQYPRRDRDNDIRHNYDPRR